MPPLNREFRGVWVATVSNIDWPSRPGLTTQTQKAELLRIIERAAELRLNAIIFQVRPACDALYPSTIEPWSEYLTGEMGKAPEPLWDPLAFAIEESHKRGIELHAWFNPYRARHPSAKTLAPVSHITKSHPHLARTYTNLLWLDPGEREVQDYAMRVILDVLRRYDVDGIHIDDYFYPYPVKDRTGKTADFPDDASWSRYQRSGGKLARNDWRRENVNTLVQRLNREIHAAKPWVKFGISPFGIWRPGHPPGVSGLDAYEELYADARKWMHEGWADYFAPQLYWANNSSGQSYSALLLWWAGQNAKGRHVWPGLYSSRVPKEWEAAEIVRQVKLARQQSGVTGHVHFSAKSLRRENGALGDTLLRQFFTEPALVPASPWLKDQISARPAASANAGSSFNVTFKPGGTNAITRFWAVQTFTGGRWTTRILPGERTSLELPGVKPEVVAVTAIDPAGNASPAAVLKRVR